MSEATYEPATFQDLIATPLEDSMQVQPAVQMQRDKVRLALLNSERADNPNDPNLQKAISDTAAKIESGDPFSQPNTKPNRGAKIAGELKARKVSYEPMDTGAPAAAPASKVTYEPMFPDEKPAADAATPTRGAIGEIGKGAQRSAFGQLPQQIGQALKWLGEEPKSWEQGGMGSTTYEIGQSLQNVGEEYLNKPENQLQPDAHNWLTNSLASGAEMLAPSMAPVAVAALLPASLPAWVSMGLGATSMSWLYGGQQAQQTYERAIAAGLPKSEARQAGIETGAIEAGGEIIGTMALGYLFGMVGKGISKATGMDPIDGVFAAVKNPAYFKDFAKKLPGVYGTEIGTEIGQNWGEAKVEEAHGIPQGQAGTPWEQGKQAIAPTFGMTTLLLPFGLVGHAMEASKTTVAAGALEDPNAPPKIRAAAAQSIYTALKSEDKDFAEKWIGKVKDAIATGAPVTLDRGFVERPAGTTTAEAVPPAPVEGAAAAQPASPAATDAGPPAVAGADLPILYPGSPTYTSGQGVPADAGLREGAYPNIDSEGRQYRDVTPDGITHAGEIASADHPDRIYAPGTATGAGFNPVVPRGTMSPIDQARADAQTLKAGLDLGVPPDSQRLKNATLVSVYGENAAVRHVIEDPEQFSALGDAMLRAAPTVERVRGTISNQGRTLDITNDILTAVDEIAKIKQSGRTVAQVMAEGVAHDISYEGQQLIEFLDANADNPEKLAGFMESYLHEVESATGVPSEVRGRAFDIIAERQAAKRQQEEKQKAEAKAQSFAKSESAAKREKAVTTAKATQQESAERVLREIAVAKAAGSGVNPGHVTAIELAFQNARKLKGKPNAKPSPEGGKPVSEGPKGGAPAGPGQNEAGRGQGPVSKPAEAGHPGNAQPGGESGNRPRPEAAGPEVVNRGAKIAGELKKTPPVEMHPTDEAAHQAATSPHNGLPEPTEAQKEAGNYKKGPITISGMQISVENPAGSKRRPEWPTLESHYGYVKDVPARAPDKEHVDVFVKPGTPTDHAGPVFVVDQNKGNGHFDEPKAMIGFANEAEAKAAYLKNYTKGWEDHIRGITEMSTDEFKQKLQDPEGFLRPQGEPKAAPVVDGKPAAGYTLKELQRLTRKGRNKAVRLEAEAELERRADEKAARPLTEKQLAARKRLQQQGNARKIVDEAHDSIKVAVAKLGGITMENRADILRDKTGNFRVPFVGSVFSPNGLGLDDMVTLLAQHGYISPEGMADVDGWVQELRDKLADSIDGNAEHYSMLHDARSMEAEMEQRHADELAAEMERQAAEGAGALELDVTPEDLVTQDLPATVANLVDADLLAAAMERIGEAAIERLAIQHENDSDFHEAVLQLAKEQADANQQQNAQAGEGGETGGRPAPAEARPSLALEGETPADLKTKAAQEEAAAKAKAEEEAKAEADKLRGGFTLTGSNRPADVGAAAGQSDIFSQHQQPIEDFGEKIGGARKDVAQPLGERTKQQTEDSAEPAWRKRFRAYEVAASTKESEVGRWAIQDTRAKGWRSGMMGGQTFATKEEAEANIPLIAVALKHRVVQVGKPVDGVQPYEIWRDVTDRKRVKVVDKTFAGRDDAMRYMALHAAEILETKTGYGEEILVKPDTVKRTGVERRTGPADSKMFTDTFGFRGVEFGLWNNQDERQEVMNHAYDGLLDLADVLGVPPRALSLNGDLALAFGARGQGLSGARAHYEPGYGVINLTKMSGAGALAHEWFHSLDHYLARQDTKAKSEKVKNQRGDMVYPDEADKYQFASHGFQMSRSQVRPELQKAYDALIKTMFTKAEQYVEDTERAAKFVAAARDALAKDLADIRLNLTRGPEQLTYMKRNNKPATAEQLALFDQLVNRIIEGEDLTTRWMSTAKEGVPARARGGMSGHMSNDSLEGISAIMKAVRGRSGFAEPGGPLNGVRYLMHSYKARVDMLKSANAEETKTKRVPTSYAMEAKKIDQGRASDYWTVPHEMAARAFSSYVEDKVAEQGNRSDFLSYGSDNKFYRLFGIRPFPEGAERQAINKAFDDFTSELKTKETDKGMALFQPRPRYDPRQLEMVYDHTPTRPDTTPKQKAEGVAALKALFKQDQKAGATLLGSALWKDFQERAGADLIGQQAGSAGELALAAQILRDPRFETMRVFFTKGNTIVGHTGWTSRLPGAVAFAINTNVAVRRTNNVQSNLSADLRMSLLIHEMKQLGADGYYLMHNHPSGRATPSSADEQVTIHVQREMPGMKAHIVIDHGEYAVIDQDGVSRVHKLPEPGPKAPELRHDALGTAISGPLPLVDVARSLTDGKPGFATLIATDGAGRIQALAEVPQRPLVESRDPFARGRAMVRIRKFMNQTGSSGGAFIVGENPKAYDWLIKNGSITDAVSTDGGRTRAETGEVFPNPRGHGREVKMVLAARQMAWHGTPYEFAPTERNKYGEFDEGKVGTGEGAAAYGWGVAYLAGRKEVAKFYRDALSSRMRGTMDWSKVKLPPGLTVAERDELTALNAKVRATAQPGSHPQLTEPERARFNELVARGREYEDAIDAAGPKGKLYQVDLTPKDDEWLDWDKPLNEQSAKVKAALAEAGIVSAAKMADLNGGGFYHFVASELPRPPNSGAATKEEIASKYFASIGIPGIRYLDGDSRNKATFNVVNRSGVVMAENFKSRRDAQNYIGRQTDKAALSVDQVGGHHNYVIFSPEHANIIGAEQPRPTYTVTPQQAFDKAKGTFTEKLDAAKEAGYRSTAQAVVDRVDQALNPLGTLPEQQDYLVRRYLAQGMIEKANDSAIGVAKAFDKATDADRQAIYDYFVHAGATSEGIKNPTVRAEAEKIKAQIGKIGDELVEHGLLSQESRDAYKDAYLPRLYLKHLLSESDWKALGAGKKPSDMGYLKARKDIPEDVRKVILGEVTDPGFLAGVALAKPARDMALLDWLHEISQNDKWILPTSLVEFTSPLTGRTTEATPYFLKEEAARLRKQARYYSPEDAVKAETEAKAMDYVADDALEGIQGEHSDYKAIPNTARYGRLRGLMVRTEIYNDLMGINDFLPTDPGWFQNVFGYGGVGTRATQIWKGMKVAMNPPAQVRNFVSNAIAMQLFAGVPLHMVPARVFQAISEIRTGGKHYAIGQKYGVGASTFSTNELARMKTELLDLELKTRGLGPLGRLHRIAALLMNKSSDFYQLSETVFKTAIIIDSMQRKGMTEEKAILAAQAALFDYSLIQKSARYARSAPIGVPFLTYQLKVLPRLIETALLHPQRFIPWVGLFYGFPMLVASMLGVGKDDLDKLKMALPEWLQDKGHALILPWKDDNGRWQVVDLGYFMPWGNWTELASDAAGGEVGKAVQAAGIFSGPVTDIIVAIKTGKDPFTKHDIWNKGDPPERQLASIINYMWSMAMPPFLTDRGLISPMGLMDKAYGGKSIQALEGTTNKYGEPRATAEQALLYLGGINVQAITPEFTRAQNLKTMQRDLNDVKLQMRQRLYDQSLTPEQRKEIAAEYMAELVRRAAKIQQYVKASEIAPSLRR